MTFQILKSGKYQAVWAANNAWAQWLLLGTVTDVFYPGLTLGPIVAKGAGPREKPWADGVNAEVTR